jgi:asparagine synthase (glutamine-hydrolysing)
MSAIFGIIRFDGEEADARIVARMAATMRHRTPDGMDIAPLGPVCLGYGKMRVQREDIFDAQPLSDDRGDVTLVVEGRLDNREALAAALEIAPAMLRDMPDSGLVLAAYRHWGEECAGHLLGDFAFAVWDRRARRLVLARDHMGQRHLFFHRGADFLAFASEIKALWAIPEVPREMDDDTVLRRMLVIRDADAAPTLFKGIDGLSGGERMSVALDGRVDRTRYWVPKPSPDHVGRDEAYYVSAYRRILGEAVACRVRRLDRRPALHMSGGFDSSAIAGLAGPVLKEQGRTILGIASVMPEARRGEFKHDARTMVEHCARHMPHLDVRFLTREGIEPFGGLDRAMPLLDGPPSTIHYVYQEAARIAAAEGVRLLMDGHGGDYTLNPRDPGALARLLARGNLRGYARELRAQRRRYGTPVLRAVASHVWLAVQPLAQRIKTLAGRRIRRLRLDRFVRDDALADAIGRNIVAEGEIGMDSGLAIERQALLVNTIARVSARIPDSAINMAAWVEGLAMTRPFHDKRVVELALAVPEALYFKDGRNRYLARTALSDVYPPEFQDRGFHNDLRVPEIAEALSEAAPELVARARNLPDDMVDRDAIAEALRSDRAWGEKKSSALVVLMVADYRRWFRGRNST